MASFGQALASGWVGSTGLNICTANQARCGPQFTCAPIGIGYRAATLIEAVATFFLALAVFAAAERRTRRMAPLSIGAATAFGSLIAGPLTGGAMNPARAFGPALAAGQWSVHYVYWVGPLAGAIAAAFVAPYLIHEENRP